MDGNVLKGAQQLAILLSDEVHYSGLMNNIGTKLRMGTVLAESGLPYATIALVLYRQAQRELGGTEVGKRLACAWHVLNGRPLAYRVALTGHVLQDDQTMIVDLVEMPQMLSDDDWAELLK